MTIEASLKDIALKKQEILEQLDGKYMGMKMSSEDEAIYDSGTWIFNYSILFRNQTRRKTPEDLIETSGLDLLVDQKEVSAPYHDKNTSAVKNFIEQLGGEVISNHSRFDKNQLILTGFRAVFHLNK